MTRAVRVALAASVTALALSTSGGAFAATCKPQATIAADCAVARGIDAAPVVDLTTVIDGSAPRASLISETDPGDIVIDNFDPQSASGSGIVSAIAAYSEAGSVLVTNHEGADLSSLSTDVATGITAYAPYGDVTIDNAADVAVEGGYWATGISAGAGGTASIANSGDIEVVADPATLVFNQYGEQVDAWAPGSGFGLYAMGGDAAVVENAGDIIVAAGDATGINAVSNGVVSISNTGDILVGDVAATAAPAIAMPDYDPSISLPVYNTYESYTPFAVGIYGLGDSVSIDNAGTVIALADNTGVGVKAYAVNDISIENDGDIIATGSSMAIGIYAYSINGDASIANSGGIVAVADDIADGIFASGADVDVDNSGEITAYASGWAAGIEAQGSESVSVTNSGDINAIAAGLYQVYAYSFYDYSGGTIYNSFGGQAFGIYATGGEGGASVDNSGDINVQAGYATGIEVQSAGDIAVTNAGDITAGSGLQTDVFYNPATYTLYYVYTGTPIATGINATSNGEGAHVGISNSGDIVADGIFAATGIAATSGGLYGSASVENSGDITVLQDQKYGYGAYGVIVSADGDGLIDNSGNVTVVSGGVASGLTALSFAGDAAVVNSGDIDVASSAQKYYAASGIVAFSANGSASVDNSGNVSVASEYIGRAIDAQGAQGATVVNSGSLYANAKYAYGVYAVSGGGDVNVVNTADGEIGFYSYLGRGFGAFGLTYAGDVNLHNAGDISGYAYGQAAGLFGVSLDGGDATVTNSGSITVVSGGNVAVGTFARADYGTATIDNSGDIIASNSGFFDGYSAYGALARGDYAVVNNDGTIIADGNYYGTGIAARSYYGTTVTTGADSSIIAGGIYTATGIQAISYYGDVNVDNAGDIGTIAEGQSVGVFAVAPGGDVSVANSGSIYSYSFLDYAVGVFARADYGQASIDNSGSVSTYSYYGDAIGLLARGDYADVSNSGLVEANGFYSATGIAASSYYGTTVSNAGGSIDVIAIGDATGIDATSLFGDVVVDNASDIEAVGIVFSATGINGYSLLGDVAIDNSGDIYAGSLYGQSIGLYGYSLLGDVSITNSGAIEAVSYYGLADGIFASGSDVAVGNSGAITAYGYTWAAGIEAQGSNSVQVTNSGDIESTAAGMYQVYAYSFYDYSGGTIYNSFGGQAFGIYATGGEGGAVVSNSGDITVQAGYATGIEVQSAGDLGIVNSGDITAGNGLQTDVFYNPATYTLYYVYTGTPIATGINATSNGEGAHVGISNSGDIVADGIFAATGIAATSGGLYGSATVVNSGNITALQDQKYGYGAYGVIVSADGDGAAANSGSIEVYSGGVASGLTVLSFAGDATVVNSGDIDVANSAQKYYAASGIVAFSANGEAQAENSGSVSVASEYIGRAIDAQGAQGATVVNSGSLYANAKYAYGVYAVSGGGDVNVVNTADGEIGFYSYLGRGFGAFGLTYAGDVNLHNAGDISGYAYGQAAGLFGVSLDGGDATVTNSGSITVISGGNVAVGAFARADYGTATIVNSGDIVASDTGVGGFYGYSAYGAFARGDYAQVGNSGSILADGNYYASGIIANSYYGTIVSASATSEIEASALLVAIGIEARSEYGDVTVGNAGSIVADGAYGGGVGIQAYSWLGDVAVTNTGDVTATSDYGMAIGVSGYSILGDTVVSNNGSIEAAGDYGAYGIAALSYFGDATVVNGANGAIHAEAPSYAYGIFARAYGDVAITNAGQVGASAGAGGYATAVAMVSEYGQSTLNNAASGVIGADGDDGYAFAVTGSDAVDTINNAGRIDGAVALYGGDDAFNNLAGGIWNVGDTQSSDFGDGDDTITNAGTIDLAGGGFSMGDGDDSIANSGLFRINDGWVDMGAGSNAFANTGTIKVLGTDGLIDLGGGTLTNGGIIDFRDGAADDMLTIAGTLAGNGRVNIDLDMAAGEADQLLVDGSIAANAVQTVNVDFGTLPTTAHTSVVFAEVTGNSVAGNFVAGQMIGYNEEANFLDLEFSIGSVIDASNATADRFSIDLDVVGLNDTGALAANVASGAAGMLNAQIGTFKQRMGVNPYGDEGKVMSAFFRTYTSEGDVDPGHVAANFGQGGNFAYDQAVWGREVGVNANLFGNFHAGLTVGTADGRQRLTGAGAGVNRMDGMTWGWYATWLQPQGFYVDLSGRWMAVDVRTTSAAGPSETRAHTAGWNLEAGYQWNFGGLSVVPQLQYTRTEVEDVRAIHGEQADFQGHGGVSSRVRLGVELSKTFQAGNLRWTPYGSVNAVRELDGEMTYTVANVFHGATSTKGTSAMAEVGVGVQSRNWAFTVGANWIDGGAYKSTVGGQAIIRFAW